MPNTIARRRTHQPRFREQWDALSSRWTAWPTGAAMAVAGGAVSGNTQAADGYNLITNPEFTVNTAGWGSVRSILTRRDFAVAPAIAPTGGLDNYGLEVQQNDGASSGYATWILGGVIEGARYQFSLRAYTPEIAHYARLLAGSAFPSIFVSQANQGIWETLDATSYAAVGSAPAAYSLWAWINSITIGKVVYFDAGWVQLTPAGCYTALRPSLRLHHVIPIPGAGTTPRGFVYRWSSALNYWELRILPNTTGTDAYLLERNAGAYTTRASADVDWTAGGNDEVMVSLAGNTITVWVRKSGAAGWTQTLQYASATFNNTAYRHGVLAYGTAAPVCSLFEEVP